MNVNTGGRKKKGKKGFCGNAFAIHGNLRLKKFPTISSFHPNLMYRNYINTK